MVDFLISIPQLPLWMALSAALPRDWPVLRTYFAITIILSIVGWTSLARVVRGKLLSLREEDYALAAQAAGASKQSDHLQAPAAGLHESPDRERSRWRCPA